ncbi:MAG: hypothetical protein HY791_38790 [Deltaproteobacteria bacterium]|nr:hypothetical protein [Deltaproteobacteria bacterium]
MHESRGALTGSLHKRQLPAAVAALFIGACATDDGEPPVGSELCEPMASDFTTLHERIFSTNTCADSLCHGAEGFLDANGLNLSGTKEEVFAALTSSTADATGRNTYAKRVVPHDPNMSFLWQVVSTDEPPGSYRMPLGGRLDTCKTDAIHAWIEDGATLE